VTGDVPGAPRRGAGVLAGAALLSVYALTLAPDVTFWDAGEFIAAAHALGIPHPPGTPLYVLLLNVWAKLLFFLPFAVATNLFSAACTAGAAALVGRMVHRWTGEWWMGISAAIAAGGMSSVWLNATETEVYAVSLALGTLMVWAADAAGREDRARFVVLTAYLMVLAVPLHLSALVAAPVAIYLAARRAGQPEWRRDRLLLLSGAFVCAMGVGRTSPVLLGSGAVLIAAAVALGGPARAQRAGVATSVLLVAAIAASVLAFLYVRAQWDPAINQGNPDSLDALMRVVARKQYAVSPVWPREAPVWIQLANLLQYADWQVALSTGPTVLPSVLRTLGTLTFVWLGVEGARHHFRADRRTAIAVLVLLGAGSLGVAAYLNMRAGPSIGYGVLPDGVMREARERDYFYVFAFWAWGIWAGMGAVVMAREYRRPAWAGLLVAALPIVLNWRAVTRRGEPEQSLPRAVAEAMLGGTPPRGVLFVAGDNDSYPLWYAQEVLGVRRDVAVVTIPLLPTRWYREEVRRRHGLLAEADVATYQPRYGTAIQVANGARAAGRPVAASVTLSPSERERLGDEWQGSGVVFVAGRAGVDTAAARHWALWVEQRLPDRGTRAAIDPVHAYFRSVLECPRQLLAHSARGDTTQLDSVCNYR
jgi:hypothetical protein